MLAVSDSEAKTQRRLDALTLGVIGAGAVGSVLGRLLAARGFRVTVVGGRAAERAEIAAGSDLVILAVPDDAVASVAAAIGDAGGWRAGRAVVHTSGALDASVLAPAATAGAGTGVLHPLQSLADREAAADRLTGVYYGLEAEPPLLGLLEGLVRRIGGVPVRIRSEAKAVYHLAAALASNATVALVAAAVELMARAGLPPADAARALLPLVRGSVENLERLGLPSALTGPASRGDAGTVARHRRALAEVAPDLLAVYDGLTRRMVRLGLAKGSLNAAGARRILDVVGDTEEERCR